MVAGHGRAGVYAPRGLFEPVAMPGDPRDLRQLSISSSGLITYATSDGVIRTMRVERTLTQ